MATSTVLTNKPINPRGDDNRPVDSYNRAALYSGKALDFDGVNDYVAIAYDASTRPTSEITLTAIAKMDWSSSTQTRILSCTEAGGYHISVGEGSFIPTGNTGMLLRLSSSGYTAVYISNTTIPDGYNAISSTFDGRYLKLYLNGTLVATTDSGETQSIYYAYNNSLFVGAEASSGATPAGSGYFNGQISNAKVFDVALTAAQVSDLYNNPEKIVPTGVSNTALKLWLPMMEGAGTTAYDGSGNGNHGTISGATYVNGVGAPVAQSAVIDWNKGSNEFLYSEDFSQTAWTKDALTLTANDTTAPDGSDTAEKVEASTSNAYIQQTKSGLDTSASYTLSVWAKTDSGTADFQIGNVDVSNYVTKTATTEWQRFEVTQTPSATTRYPRIFRTSTSDAVTIYLWGAQLEKVSSVGAYIPNHTGTPITSPVLLPQGLTTGRDITGVNLFENVRKQGALNLDGNSWAEVHDNASLDFGTGSFTLEAWARVKYVAQGSSVNSILALGGNGWSPGSASITIDEFNKGRFHYNGSAEIGATTLSEGYWVHIVGTYDKTNATLYINGLQDRQAARTAADMTNALVKMIGRDGTTSRYYNDQIAQPRIYNRALTASEVLNNYNATKTQFQ